MNYSKATQRLSCEQIGKHLVNETHGAVVVVFTERFIEFQTFAAHMCNHISYVIWLTFTAE